MSASRRSSPGRRERPHGAALSCARSSRRTWPTTPPGRPVVLVGDIDRGGVIGALVGTHALLAAAERARLKGYIINKFRGDTALFDGAVATLRERTGLACHGIVPFFAAARDLPAEDGMALDGYTAGRNGGGAGGRVRIAVPRLTRIAHFHQLYPL